MIHMRADRRGRLLLVTSGQHQDSTPPLSCPIADRAYDGDAFHAWLAQKGARPSFPSGAGARTPNPTTRNGTRRATLRNEASASSNVGTA